MTDTRQTDLKSLVAGRSGMPVPPSILSIAEAVRRDAGETVVGILAYGSCLRDVRPDEGLVDLYALVDDYRKFHGNPLARFLNRLIPPNVYYGECEHDGVTIRTKYAVVSIAQFERRVSPVTRNPYFWARFAQPSAIVFAQSGETRDRIETALARAVATAADNGTALAGDDADPGRLWTVLFENTYRTELRSEHLDRAGQIVDADRDFYEAAVRPHTPGSGAGIRPGNWGLRRIEGKLLSVARLMKAAFTFQGGTDYLAWKIARHSGVAIEVKPWQRRHPILAAVILLPKLYARGGFR